MEKNPNILVALNKREFSGILKHYYGESYNAEQYYDKIFDYEFEISTGKNARNYLADVLRDEFGAQNSFDNYLVDFNEYFSNEVFQLINSNNYRKIRNLAEELAKAKVKLDYLEEFDTINAVIVKILKVMDYQKYLKLKNSVYYIKKRIRLKWYNDSADYQIDRADANI